MNDVYPSEARPALPKGKKRLKVILSGLCVVAICATMRYYWGGTAANAAPPKKEEPSSRAANPASASSTPKQTSPKSEAAGGPAIPAVVATVNTQRIVREDLGRECVRQHGEEVLGMLVNRELIAQECSRQKITVTPKEVDEEIDRMAKQLNVPRDKLLNIYQQERNIKPSQYANDIVWPTLALRKLAGENIGITREEKVREFESLYGESISARLIALNEEKKAEEVHAQALANPDDFGNLAKKYSQDGPSAGAKGIIQPIRRHGGYPEIEEAVFNMKDGEISPVIQAGGQFVILKREKLIPAQKANYEKVEASLEESLRDRKSKSASQELFQRLQKNAKIENIWNDAAKHEKTPDVAALVNGIAVSMQELTRECIQRHGQDVLEGMINRKILEEACTKRNISVSDEDVRHEIENEAMINVKPKDDGSPDVAAWLELVTKRRGIPEDVYRNHIVWPTVVLKKMVHERVEVTDEDLKKGYEANYGPRVRCLAIVLDDQRRASRVFDLARKNNTAEYFGELAAQYSVESSTRSLRGEVPPIKKNGGQPILEQEAFALKPGEISGVIPLDEKFVILRCEGLTEPTDVEFAKVRDDIYQDIFEKKQDLAMREAFNRLQETASIDNFLTNSTHAPNFKASGESDSKQPARAPDASRAEPAGSSKVSTVR
jgi:parvulin-like peptidyl-prolyl isomerase